MTEHKEKGRLTGCLIRSSLITVEDLGQTNIPIPRPGHRQSAQQVVEGPIKTFTLAIADCVILGCVRLLNPIKAIKLLNKSALKIAVLI